MSDPELRRADELLTDLVELVETARAVPISGSCIIPREHTLDLLDDLREVLPAEMSEARLITADRDRLLATARAEATQARADAEAGATAQLAEAESAALARTAAAEEHVAQLVADARAEAARLIEEGQVENARLVSSAGVHQAATAAAEQVRSEADRYASTIRASAEEYAAQVRGAAEQYAAELQRNADAYAETTLGEIVATLQRSAATAERGRAEIAARQRTDGHPAADIDAGTRSGPAFGDDHDLAGELYDQAS